MTSLAMCSWLGSWYYAQYSCPTGFESVQLLVTAKTQAPLLFIWLCLAMLGIVVALRQAVKLFTAFFQSSFCILSVVKPNSQGRGFGAHILCVHVQGMWHLQQQDSPSTPGRQQNASSLCILLQESKLEWRFPMHSTGPFARQWLLKGESIVIPSGVP